MRQATPAGRIGFLCVYDRVLALAVPALVGASQTDTPIRQSRRANLAACVLAGLAKAQQLLCCQLPGMALQPACLLRPAGTTCHLHAAGRDETANDQVAGVGCDEAQEARQRKSWVYFWGSSRGCAYRQSVSKGQQQQYRVRSCASGRPCPAPTVRKV